MIQLKLGFNSTCDMLNTLTANYDNTIYKITICFLFFEDIMHADKSIVSNSKHI